MTNQPAHPHISIVVPMYNEAESAPHFYARMVPVLEAITPHWEIIAVNDGSKDATLELMRANHANDPRLRYVSFSRNFGKECALSAGLQHAYGDVVIPIDADLQDPPELIPEMMELWRQGNKVVIATRSGRPGEGWFKRKTAHVFHMLFAKLARFNIPADTGDFRLMDQQVVAIVRLLPERTRFMKGLFAWAGFKTAQVYYVQQPRVAGQTKFGLVDMFGLAKDGIFSFTSLPLQVSTYTGVTISFFTLAYAAYLAIRTMLHGVDVPGYASLMTAVLFMGGIQLIFLGVLGEYIGRIYTESKQRPLYVIEEAA
jgi:glycosyltransferase involved in cell wall biosynthesis